MSWLFPVGVIGTVVAAKTSATVPTDLVGNKRAHFLLWRLRWIAVVAPLAGSRHSHGDAPADHPIAQPRLSLT
jgi:hypothetical protein